MSSIDNDSRFNFLQATAVKEKWYTERRGMFTASEIFKLLSKGSNELFGAGAKSYIKKKAIEKLSQVWEVEEQVGDRVPAMAYGKNTEQEGFLAYQKHTKNYAMRYFGSNEHVFLNYDDNSGGSPDGLLGEGETVYLGLEIKCPYSPEIHLSYWNMEHPFDLQDRCLQYYAQIQFLMMITKAPTWHFCSYDPRFIDPRFRVYVLEIPPDKKFQSNLHLRVKAAVQERDKIIEIYQTRLPK